MQKAQIAGSKSSGFDKCLSNNKKRANYVKLSRAHTLSALKRLHESNLNPPESVNFQRTNGTNF